jgi:hypothetical protein
MAEYKLDRNSFKMQKAEEAGQNFGYWKQKTYLDRLNAACYLNSVAFNYDLNNPPKLERSYFLMRKRK